AGCLLQQLRGMSPERIAAGMIGNQADALALQWRELFSSEHIEPAANGGGYGVDHLIELAPGIASDWCTGGGAANGAGERIGNAAAQWSDIAFVVWKYAVGEDDRERVRDRIDPQRSAGVAGVAIDAARHHY